MTGVLVAHRGEIALRIIRAAHARGLRAVAVHAADEPDAAHVRAADEAVALDGTGSAPFLDAAQVVDAAVRTGCHLLHPGYGFLSEDPALAWLCAERGVGFVGPSPDTLELLGDKTSARLLAERLGIPVLGATRNDPTDAEALTFLRAAGAVMVKARAGGGGRGMRVVSDPDLLLGALARCRSEAERAFARAGVYLEAFLPRTRHVEVQLLGDGHEVAVLGDRDCSVQRRHQKMIEIAPAVTVPAEVRECLAADAHRLGTEVGLTGLATVEFLVDADRDEYVFLEVNPRLQVEHPVTEEVLGLDLVGAQLAVAEGAALAELALPTTPHGISVEARITLTGPPSGPVGRFAVPAGVRVETHVEQGRTVAADYDPLLAKVVVLEPGGDLAAAVDGLDAALAELVLEGVPTDLPRLRDLLARPELRKGEVVTTWVDELAAPESGAAGDPANSTAESTAVRTAVTGTVVALPAQVGARVRRGTPLVVVEAMKMEHEVTAPVAGIVRALHPAVGDRVCQDETVAELEALAEEDHDEAPVAVDPAHVRADLADVRRRHAVGTDESRPAAVAKRRRLGKRTARENVAALCDPGTDLREYGALVIAAQRTRRPVEELERNTPADGLVAGFGTVHDRPVAVLAHDYTVLAGTQGVQVHKKTERLFELAGRRGTPVVVFAEGGGGRPGDVDNAAKATGMDLGTFVALGRLNGLVPTVAIASGRCFAGNAALAGACDLVIATEDVNLGMGGPAMIEGGGLGRFSPEEIGPLAVQVANGVVDVAVADEAEAADVARRYLSYFQDPAAEWECADQRLLRHVVPEDRHRVFDVRALVDLLCDTGSVLELRRGFGGAVVTALVRIEGRPVGLLANDGAVGGGALDADAADKAARFLQLCDAHGLPVLSLCDTPGFLVGPDAERAGGVRHFGRLFVTGPNLSVPLCTVVVRKAYGLGGQAMAGGGFRVPDAIVGWPTAEFGAMGPEGAVTLGYRRELEAIEDPERRRARYDELLADYVAQGSAVNAASVFELDDVIDPADTRSWVSGVLDTRTQTDGTAPRLAPTRRRIDTW
ncbi:acetyl-CoA carboxylase family protein [Pseudonocardia xishanensis]|uniref:acetyl-CoA carboxylase n=1 Tax=Pseudonocardia xishanensis TaxID=630995 RepID=A0ABP8RCK9_9PSEU